MGAGNLRRLGTGARAGGPQIDSAALMADAHGSFRYRGHRIAYDVHGEGDRALVLIHGLLMNRRMYDRLAPEMAARGNRVITVDLLGHGESDKPDDMRIYAMGSLAGQAAALVDHLGLRPRWSEGHRWGRTWPWSSPSTTPRAPAGCSSRCRFSRTRCWAPR